MFMFRSNLKTLRSRGQPCLALNEYSSCAAGIAGSKPNLRCTMGRHTRGVKTVRQLVRLLAEPPRATGLKAGDTARVVL